MNVPLQVKSVTQNNKELLSIWFNRQNVVVPPAVRPYFYSRKNLSIKCVKKSTIRKIALSDFQEHTFYKYEFNTIDELLNNRIQGFTFEDNIPFIIRNRIDAPKYYSSFAHTKDLIFNFLDIEQNTPSTKLFPTYDDLITSISFASNSREIKSIFLRTETETDIQLLKNYCKYYPHPDVEVVYNKSYDLPTIYERCKINGLDIRDFTKNQSSPFFGGKYGVSIEGTVVFDALDSAMKDQSLNGNVPNRGLKAVSDYFGFKSTAKVLKGSEITQAKGTKELVEYNKEDVRRLLYLFDIYWPGITYTAEDLGMPLSEVVSLSTTDLGNIVLGDLYREHNIIADGKNEDRYPEIFKRPKKKDEKNYQGAIVDIYQKGLFKHVKKADYSSMYPNILSEFNFSPDTCTLLDYEPYEDNFRIEENDDSYTYYIPDNQIKKVVVIQTKKQKGFLSEAVERFLDERAKFKKEYKKTGSKIAEARSNIAKVKANGGIYGNMGSAKSPFGFVPAAIATCGIGRQCAMILIDVLNKIHPNSVIELDTDGAYFTAENIDKKKIIDTFYKELEKKFKKPLKLGIDIDEYDTGYFHKAKNYVLKNGDTIIFHGTAMKSSKKENLSKKLIKELATAKLNEESTVSIIHKYMNLKSNDFELSDFAMQTTLGMHPKQYKNNSLSYRMAMLAQDHFGMKAKKGNSYHYVKTHSGYQLFQLATKQDLDIDYYKKKLQDVIEMFEGDISTSLSDFGISITNSSETIKVKEKTNKTRTIGLDVFM